MKILINAGHAPNGDPDPGAVGPTGLRECDVVLDVANRMRGYLQLAGVEADVMQHDDLDYICNAANTGGYELFLSIHCNSFNETAKGIEVFTSRGLTYADFFATCLMAQVHATFPGLVVRSDWTDGDVDKEMGLYVLNNTNMPAALFELPFISNPAEEEWLRNTSNLEEVAKAFARAVTDYIQGI